MSAHEEDGALPATAVVALSHGRMIEAIKVVRETSGVGLAEAKARVERYVAQNPALRQQFAAQQKEMRRRFVRWTLIIDVALIAGVLWWMLGR
jgi:ribosomal protein L7/L12